MIDRRLLLPAAGCAFFGALLLLEAAAGTTYPAAPIATGPKPSLATAAPTDAAPEPKQLLSAILDRPLFSATRRPPQTTEISANFELGGARLTGIVIAPDTRFAIFEVKGSKPLVLNEGQTVSGWRVDSIAPAEVSLVGPAGSKTLQPKPDPAHAVGSPNPSTAQAAPPAGVRPRGPGRESQR